MQQSSNKPNFTKTVVLHAAFMTSLLTFYYGQSNVAVANIPSNFESAINNLGFTTIEQQESLLSIFQMAGYFNKELLKQSIYNLGNIKNPEEVFRQIDLIANNNPNFNVSKLRTALNNISGKYFTKEDFMDWLLYMAQYAFNRKPGQERNELVPKDWMSQHKEQYLKLAATLGLTERKLPEKQKYDACWIAGASRTGLLARLIDYINTAKLHNIIIKNNAISILAGGRELWAEIDGIHPELKQQLIQALNNTTDLDSINTTGFHNQGNITEQIEEGKEYFLSLASINNIELNQSEPFIKRPDQPGRTYPNYKDSIQLQPRLTETLMSQDLLKTYFPGVVSIVDTKEANGQRPNTATTAQDAAEKFIQRIKDGFYEDQKEFVILLQTNNPYIERQTLSAQMAVDDVLQKSGLNQAGYKIKLIGAGFRAHASVAVINSELGALLTEKWKLATKHAPQNHRDIKQLLFSSRNNSLENSPKHKPKF